MRIVSIEHFISKYRYIIRGGAFSLFSIINQGAGFVLLILLARYILPSDYGVLSMFNTFVQLLTFWVAFSSGGYVSVSYFSARDRCEFIRDFSSILVLGGASILIMIFILSLARSWISEVLGLNYNFIGIGLFVCMTTFVHNMHLDLIRIQERTRRYGLFSCGCALGNFILSLVLVIGYDCGWVGRVYANVIISCLFGILALFFFYKQKLITRVIEWTRLKRILCWGIPIIPHLASNWIKQGCDRIIINTHYTSEEVGLFSFALNLVSIITMIGMGFNQVNSLETYKILGNMSYTADIKREILKKQRKNFMLIYVVCVCVVVITCVLGIPLVLPKYELSVYYFIPLSLYGLGVCVYLLYCNYLFYYNNTTHLMYITFSSSVLHLILSLLFTRLSLWLTAVIYVVTQMYIVIAIHYKAKQILREKVV